MRILLTNDDGIGSAGLLTLVRELSPLGELTVFAPDRERSGASHAFTTQGKPVRLRELELWPGRPALAVEGTPVDCVKVALFLEDGRPLDWVVAGINLGANVGVDAFYSGTVAAACEGALQGVRSVAFSQALDEGFEPDLSGAARLSRQVFQKLLTEDVPAGTCLSVNLPARPPEAVRGIWVGRQARQRYLPYFTWGPSQDGYKTLIKAHRKIVDDPDTDADYARLRAGWITITPLTLDRTDRARLEAMRAWNWTL